MSYTTRPYLPPEWAPQSAVMITWPHADSDWRARIEEVQHVFLAIARVVCRHERLVVVCHDEDHREHLRAVFTAADVGDGRYVLHVAPSNDTWTRDHGPIGVIEGGRPVLLDFTFNGWGGKFPATLDNAITRTLHAAGAFADAELRTLPLVLEGGSFDVDGLGTLLTTASCLLAPTRNPGLSRSDMEARLRGYLGIDRVLWLEHGGLLGDDTDGHVDTLARFCSDRTLCYVTCPDPSDWHYAELQAMENELRCLRRADGGPYRLVPLPWPQPRFDEHGHRLPATYANFLVINGAVLVPTYDDPADRHALATLQGCFPDRQVEGIPCLPLIHQFGSLHCVTMQLPAGLKV